MASYGGHWLLKYSWFYCPRCGEKHDATANKCRKCGLDFTVKEDKTLGESVIDGNIV